VKIHGRHYRSIWVAADGSVQVIDQTALPHELRITTLATLDDAAAAIRTMRVRGAPLIGATASYGVCLGLREDPSDSGLAAAVERLSATRPTAVNLRWALDEMAAAVSRLAPEDRAEAAFLRAAAICDEDVEICRRIGVHGLAILRELAAASKGRPLNLLTHCNAGWLATVDWGTALAPIYMAHDAGLPVHVFVDETRPRGQSALLTAYELGAHGVPCTVVADNAGGHLMQQGRVDLCLVGSDRTTATGDVANKIGTYLKALAARDNGVPFYVALPSSSFDWQMRDGLREIPIEDRGPAEVKLMDGWQDGTRSEVLIAPPMSPAANPGFDITPARLITALITERGLCAANEAAIGALFPEHG
jgi:methylthioribose-1-phosphate isomerase